MLRPTIPRSPPKRLFHRSWRSTTTCVPGFSSSARNPRPNTGCTPSRGNRSRKRRRLEHLLYEDWAGKGQSYAGREALSYCRPMASPFGETLAASSSTARLTSAAVQEHSRGAPNEITTGCRKQRGRFLKKRPPRKLNMLSQRPPRWTGTIGASIPLIIASNPRLNGSSSPVRLMEPSAKMQITSPRSSSLRAALIACAALRGAGHMGIDLPSRHPHCNSLLL
jgi:hypothetical protein